MLYSTFFLKNKSAGFQIKLKLNLPHTLSSPLMHLNTIYYDLILVRFYFVWSMITGKGCFILLTPSNLIWHESCDCKLCTFIVALSRSFKFLDYLLVVMTRVCFYAQLACYLYIFNIFRISIIQTYHILKYIRFQITILEALS